MQDPIFNGNLGNVKSSWKSWPTANIHFGDLSRLGNWSNTSQVAPRRSQWSLAGCEDTSQMDIIWMGFLDSGFNNHTSLMPNKGLNSFLKLKCWCFLIMLAMSSAHDLVLQHGASCCFTLCACYIPHYLSIICMCPMPKRIALARLNAPASGMFFSLSQWQCRDSEGWFVTFYVHSFFKFTGSCCCWWGFTTESVSIKMSAFWSRLVISDKLVPF